ncbi:hypothetical protein SMI01S_24760 [Sphingobacterium mizutaii NBRC 14946 = DSM 11724]|uniref:Outer membrane protein beta-barrel domain-containing protein n=2 Tax=Sphingobacterium mizutaii TaxID=1010 RepID=A0AAJ5BZK8_9SPHI|nr:MULTISPECIES: hypothetical protein [Sphingobacterium]GEM68870.1 hypothetical protein SMI01S_24760 [Sphingobacterium mizutaii NBRC 14946 = DSM 11724]SDK89667.1 hypothetical protein SAMN05192578_101204 [Sphingobacterium mizutaii]SNV47019.1 Uncharacterised protein [Sphingobacterium mizutaii]
MKKTLLSLAAAAALVFGFNEAKAQTPYKTAIGLAIDLGDGATLFGPQIKHSFGGNNAGNAQVLFGDNFTAVGADYSYNQQFAGTNGLGWYVGVGPQLGFGGDETWFAVRPAAGLEYKIPAAPLALHFDWKPWWNLSHESNFEAARFSLGFKFTLK